MSFAFRARNKFSTFDKRSKKGKRVQFFCVTNLIVGITTKFGFQDDFLMK